MTACLDGTEIAFLVRFHGTSEVYRITEEEMSAIHHQWRCIAGACPHVNTSLLNTLSATRAK
jgi:hypothetical protein